jgi:hypothetical protein
LLFGAGSGLSDVLSVLPPDIEVVGLCDNDATKHGKTILGHRVDAPDSLNELGFDFVLVTARAGNTMRNQLLEMGIERERILLFHSSFDNCVGKMVNQDMEALNRHLGIGLHPTSLCTMQIGRNNFRRRFWPTTINHGADQERAAISEVSDEFTARTRPAPLEVKRSFKRSIGNSKKW